MVPLEVPEWGCTVHLKPFNGYERRRFVKNAHTGNVLYGEVMRQTLCDEHGHPLFTADDVDALEKKSGKVLDRVGGVIMRLNGIGVDAVDEAKND